MNIIKSLIDKASLNVTNREISFDLPYRQGGAVSTAALVSDNLTHTGSYWLSLNHLSQKDLTHDSIKAGYSLMLPPSGGSRQPKYLINPKVIGSAFGNDTSKLQTTAPDDFLEVLTVPTESPSVFMSTTSILKTLSSNSSYLSTKQTVPTQISGNPDGPDTNINDLNPAFASKYSAVQSQLQNWVSANYPGYTVKLTEGLRSSAYQQKLYAQGRTTQGNIVTYKNGVSSPSNHQSGNAADVGVFNAQGQYLDNPPEAIYTQLGALAKANGLTWGGSWKNHPDPDHIEFNANNSTKISVGGNNQKIATGTNLTMPKNNLTRGTSIASK